MILDAYIISWVVASIYGYLQYRDVVTTMQNIAKGAIETNPNMIPYVKVGQPWLMAKGKIKNGAWAGVLSIVFPPAALATAIDCVSIYKAVKTNEEVAKKL